MKVTSITTPILLLASIANADTVEEWECQDRFSPSNVLAEAKVNEGRITGTIAVAGVVHKTMYQVSGFERRWDFGLQQNGSFTYSFIISPDGKATYYDFGKSKTAKPSIFMTCKQKNPL